MTSLERWNELSELFRYDPHVVSESQYRELISYARTRIHTDPDYWQGKVAGYKEQIKQRRDEWDSRKEPAPKPDPAKEVREELMESFCIGSMDDQTIKLVEFLIRAIPPEKFKPAKPARSWLDQAFFDHVKRLVEVEGMKLTNAYEENDRVFEQRPGSTATRFSRLRLKTASGAEWSPDGVKRVRTDHPLHPEVIEFCKKHDQRGKS